jgi:phosphohistidine phosphatase
MGLNAVLIHEEPALYKESANVLLALLRDIPNSVNRVLLVGHDPELDDLLATLTGTLSVDTEDGVHIPRGALAHLRLTQTWQELEPGNAALQTIVRPKILPDKFPYIDENDGIELRDRPAYYYTQSGVVPYRIVDGRVKVLVVTSSSGRHWVMPKGIAEPGISLQESALHEANEEAGVDGILEQEQLGVYQYDKWGSQCTVTVYPLLVLKETPEAQREEKHRERRWVSPIEAMEILHYEDQAGMVKTLLDRLKGTA